MKTSRIPSPSKSAKAAEVPQPPRSRPDPFVSGIHFFPKAPLTWTKETPHSEVTSSKRIAEGAFVGSAAGVGETGAFGERPQPERAAAQTVPRASTARAPWKGTRMERR